MNNPGRKGKPLSRLNKTPRKGSHWPSLGYMFTLIQITMAGEYNMKIFWPFNMPLEESGCSERLMIHMT